MKCEKCFYGIVCVDKNNKQITKYMKNHCYSFVKITKYNKSLPNSTPFYKLQDKNFKKELKEKQCIMGIIKNKREFLKYLIQYYIYRITKRVIFKSKQLKNKKKK